MNNYYKRLLYYLIKKQKISAFFVGYLIFELQYYAQTVVFTIESFILNKFFTL